MRIVAVGTQQIALGTIPVTDPAPMDALAPITVDRAVALTAQPIGLVEADQGIVDKPQTVAVVRVVTIEAPAVCRAVLEVDVVVEILELPALAIDLHVGVAFGAREDPFLGERRRWHPEDPAGLLRSRDLDLFTQREVKFDLREIGRCIGFTAPGVRADVADTATHDREQSEQRQGNEDDQQ